MAHPAYTAHGRPPLKVLAGALFFLVFVCSAGAQTIFGTITGTVTDVSGAVIPAAEVSVIHEATGARRRLAAGDTGVYVVANLDLGVYTLLIEKSGFQGYKRTGMHLAANQVINVDAQLAVSPVATTVEVTGAVGAELNTQTATLNNVMPSSQLQQLPVITRQKGDQGLWGYASYNNGIGHEPFFVANGSRYVDTQPTVDGITVMSYETGVGGSTVMTGMEATAELHVQLANAPAEFSRPVQMTMVSKSGANELHGSIFEDYNGSSLNARDFFAKTVPFRVYNNFGASLGGPIRKNGTFFFGAYEGSRDATEVVNTMNVPLTAWRNGDFSELSKPLVNPYTGASFAGNRIPAAMLSPVSQKLAAIYFPYPNYGAPTLQAGNFRDQPRPGINGVTIFDRVDARIDHNFSVRDTFFGRFSYSRMPLNAYIKNAVLPLGHRISLRTANSAVLSWTHTFNPNLLNELRAGYTRDRNLIESGVVGSDILQQTGLQGITVSGIPTYPILSVSGLTSAGQVSNYLGVGTNFQVSDSVSWMRGSHAMKFGFDVVRDRNAGFQYGGDVYGQYSFNGVFTGSPFADFLLGVPTKIYNSLPNPANYMFGTWWSAYAQDQFKLTRQLTLTYGIRWEAQGPYYDKRGLIANFNPKTGAWVIPDQAEKYISPAFSSDIPVETASQAGYPARTLLQSHHAYFYPRIGVAYRPWADKSTVIRGGYGIYANTIYGSLGGTLQTGPYSGSQSRTNSFSNGQAAFSFPNPFLTPGINTPVNAASGIDPRVRVPYLQQWNLTVEQEAARFILSASYVGGHAVNLLYFANLNQARASTQPFSVSRLPYPNYSDIIWAQNGATEHYHALQLAARRTYGKTLFLNAGYTWARDLTNAQDQTGAVGVQPQDSYNLNGEYGPNSFVRAHRFFTNLAYSLPLGRGQRFLNHAPQAADLVLGGWRMAWNVVAESGRYYTPTFDSTDPSNTNTFGGRPDRFGNIFAIPGCPATNPLCSTPANVGRFGNCGVNVLQGPKFMSADLALMKDFPVSARMTLQFRATMINVFNHPNFAPPAADIESPGTFGKFTSTCAPLLGQNARQLNLMLRLVF